MVCMASLLSSNSRNLAYFDNIHLELSKPVYFEICFHPIVSKYQDSENRFYDIITNELYWEVKEMSNALETFRFYRK